MTGLIIDTPKDHEIAESLKELVESNAELAKQVAALNIIIRDIQKAVKTVK